VQINLQCAIWIAATECKGLLYFRQVRTLVTSVLGWGYCLDPVHILLFGTQWEDHNRSEGDQRFLDLE
jgi:hypothetical protein